MVISVFQWMQNKVGGTAKIQHALIRKTQKTINQSSLCKRYPSRHPHKTNSKHSSWNTEFLNFFLPKIRTRHMPSREDQEKPEARKAPREQNAKDAHFTTLRAPP